MRQNVIKLSPQDAAVITAAGLVHMAADSPDRIDRIYSGCNSILHKFGHPTIDRSTFESIYSKFIGSGICNRESNEINLPLMNIKQRNPRDAKELVKIRKLPCNIILQNKILKKNNIKFEIKFNCDGNGNIMLPDTTVTSKNLQQLSDELVRQYKLRDTEGKGGYMRWIVVKDNIQFDKWMKVNYPI